MVARDLTLEGRGKRGEKARGRVEVENLVMNNERGNVITALHLFNSACSSQSPTIIYSYPPLDIHFIHYPSLGYVEVVPKLLLRRWFRC